MTPEEYARRTGTGTDGEAMVRKEMARVAAEKARKEALAGLGQDGDYIRGQTKAGILNAQTRQTPQMQGAQVGQVQGYGGATINQGPQGQTRDHQMALAQRLAGVGDGSVMGAGQMAARQEGNRAIAQQQAMARMGRGGNAALAARGAAMNTGNIGLNVAGQAAQAQRADAQMANQTRAQILDSTRGQDIGLATSQAGMTQQAGLASMDAQNQRIFQQAGLDQATSLANMQSKLQMIGMNDQAILGYLSQLYGVSTAELQARVALENGQGEAPGTSTGRQLLGGALVAGGTIVGGIYGGPAGAAAGGAAGGAVNQSI